MKQKVLHKGTVIGTVEGEGSSWTVLLLDGRVATGATRVHAVQNAVMQGVTIVDSEVTDWIVSVNLHLPEHLAITGEHWGRFSHWTPERIARAVKACTKGDVSTPDSWEVLTFVLRIAGILEKR